MTRLIVVVEGQTEEQFVNATLAPHLNPRGVFVSATIVGKRNAQRRGHRQRGGGQFHHWRRDLIHILGQRSADLRVTTLFDLYGLPRDFPGADQRGASSDTSLMCDNLQKALGQDIDDPRFIPYLQRHEFETLVLASLPSLRKVLEVKEDLEGLARLERDLKDVQPEDVNDHIDSAPSKRLEANIRGYRKTLHGPLAVEDTGLIQLRARCPRFDAWVHCLEDLG